MRRLLSILAAILAAISLDAHAQRQLEPLGRGLVAVRTGTASTYIGWRLLGNDPENIAFNIYRSIGTSSPIKLNPQPLTNTTDFQDTTATFASSLTYHIRPVISGIEQPASPSFTHPPQPRHPPILRNSPRCPTKRHLTRWHRIHLHRQRRQHRRSGWRWRI
jgi:hypothetical protein